MSERFARGGRLLAVGATPAARSDARHVAVEFVHPVIVGKRALPAIALAAEGGDVAAQLELVGRARRHRDGFGACPLAIARARGCLTIAFTPSGAEWELVPETEDPFVAQELVETAYHVLWELVHVFLEHRVEASGRRRAPRASCTRSSAERTTLERRASPTCAPRSS